MYLDRPDLGWLSWGEHVRARLLLIAVATVALAAWLGAMPALAAETITVSSTAGTLGTGADGQCTLRDALVVADEGSNPALDTDAESGGGLADVDCTGETSGSGTPFTIVLAPGAAYQLAAVDNYWFGPDGLPPISAEVTIDGNGATITRSTAGGVPGFRFFYVSGGVAGLPEGSLTLNDLTLSNGLAHGGDSNTGGGGAGMGGAIFDGGALTLDRVTLSGNTAQGGNPNDGSLGFGGGGIGSNASAGSPADGGGFGGSAPGAQGGGGGAGSASHGGGGGGGFNAGDTGQTATGSSGAVGGGEGGFGSAGGGDGAGDGGQGGSTGAGGLAGGAFGSGGVGTNLPVSDSSNEDAGGGGGVGGGGGAGGAFASGGGGGFGGGGGSNYLENLIAPGNLVAGYGAGGFGGGGAGGGGGCSNGCGVNAAVPGGFGGGGGTASTISATGNGGGGAGMGGAVFSMFGKVSVSDSTLSGNSALGGAGGTINNGAAGGAGSGYGGAVFNLNGSLSITGSTIASNTVSPTGDVAGGVYNLADENTIAEPEGAATNVTVTVKNSIVHGNTSNDLLVDQLGSDTSNGTTAGANVIGASSGLTGPAPLASNPLLGPLQDNGGSLATMAPGAGSPALGAGSGCDATDEIGTPRPAGDCDLGALELTLALPVVSTSAAGASSLTGATLNGTVNPNGGAATYHFEVSTNPSFASSTSVPAAGGSLPAGIAVAPVHASATGLAAGTTYYYRLVASNAGTAGHFGGGSATSAPPTKFTTLAAPTQSTTTTVGDLGLTLTAPSLKACTRNTGKLAVTLKSSTRRKGAKAKFASASFFIDKGVKHVKHVKRHGKKQTVTTHTANATVKHLPVRLGLSLKGLKPGTHSLTVKVTYKETRSEHGHRTTVELTTTLKASFKIC